MVALLRGIPKIIDAMVDAAANIAVSKLAAGTKGYAVLSDTTGAKYERIDRKNRIENGSMRVLAQTRSYNSAITVVDNAETPAAGWRSITNISANFPSVQVGTHPSTTLVPSTGGSNAAIIFQAGSGNGKVGIFYPIRNQECHDLRGQTVSLQLKAMKYDAGFTNVKAAVLVWTGTTDAAGALTDDPISTWDADTGDGLGTLVTGWALANTPANLSITGSYATYKIENISISSSMNNLGVVVWSDDATSVATKFLCITDVQLEAGTICTDFERNPQFIDRLGTQGTVNTADIADGAITSAKILDGTIATGDLANGAISAVQSGSNIVADVTATTATWVDTGVSISYTAAGEGRVVIPVSGMMANDSGSAHRANIGLWAGAVGSGTLLAYADGSGNFDTHSFIYIATLTGSHTLRIGINNPAATGTARLYAFSLVWGVMEIKR